MCPEIQRPKGNDNDDYGDDEVDDDGDHYDHGDALSSVWMLRWRRMLLSLLSMLIAGTVDVRVDVDGDVDLNDVLVVRTSVLLCYYDVDDTSDVADDI